jgi:hypothetical protein
MTLAYVQLVVAVVVALCVSWAGLLMAVALALPRQTGIAEIALEENPKRSFFTGLGLLIVFFIAIRLIQLPFPLIKALAFTTILGLSAMLTVGAAGLAQLMGQRIGEMSGAKTSFGALVRGSLVYSLALCFPYMGWFLFAPLSGLCALGAGASALWPRRHRMAMPPVTPHRPMEGQGVA